MKISGTGALVGAGIGAAARSTVIMHNLGEGASLVFILPSAAIGVLVGLIAGGIGKPLLGAIVGGVLSAVVFELFMLPCASLIGTFGVEDAEGKFLRDTLRYALEMGVAGALAGGFGGWAGSRVSEVKEEGGERKPPTSIET